MSNTFTVINPYNYQELGNYEYTELPQLEEALKKLKYGQASQQRTTAFERSDVLRKLASLLAILY